MVNTLSVSLYRVKQGSLVEVSRQFIRKEFSLKVVRNTILCEYIVLLVVFFERTEPLYVHFISGVMCTGDSHDSV